MIPIETERLLLRSIAAQDADDIFEMLSDRQTCLDDGGYPAIVVKDAEFYALIASFSEQNRCSIVLKAENKVIGIVNLQDADRAVEAYELGFVLNKAYRRKGYMYEAIGALIRTCFERTEIKMFTASHFPHNAASKALIRKLGFQYEGFRKNAVRHETLGVVDLECYYLEK